jgi:hypothetical protein
MAAFSPFDQQNADYLGGLSYRRPRQLEFNQQTGQWEDSQLNPDAYDKKYASNEERGSFKTFGTTQGMSPDNASNQERADLSPIGAPDFYGGTQNNSGPLQGLRTALAEEDAKKLKKERGY